MKMVKRKAVILQTGESVETNHVVIAVGGKSVPQSRILLRTICLGMKKRVIQSQNYSNKSTIFKRAVYTWPLILQGLALRDINLSVLTP